MVSCELLRDLDTSASGKQQYTGVIAELIEALSCTREVYKQKKIRDITLKPLRNLGLRLQKRVQRARSQYNKTKMCLNQSPSGRLPAPPQFSTNGGKFPSWA